MKLHFVTISVAFLAVSCGDPDPGPADLDQLARSYLFLELSMGQHDPAHVDAYFGPDDLGMVAIEKQLPLSNIDSLALEMIEVLERELAADREPPEKMRSQGLLYRLQALRTRVALTQGATLSFDEESQNLFGRTAPHHDAEYFDAILAEIDELLPGSGGLAERVNNFRNRFVIPEDRLSAVFDAAIAECRRRTLRHMELPDGESFSLEYVTGKSWSGYNWYQGDAHSLIQINTDLPIFISRAVDLGCHEGYPGHHTFNTLIEQNLVRNRGWLEYSLYPLFSPQSLIAEGSGNYGIELAFPGDDRVQFEKDVLFQLADLDAAEADRYYRLLSILDRLNYAGNEAARDYLNGAIDRQQAIDWLVRYSLSSPERAEQRTRFFDDYRSYVINYNLGKDLVADYIEKHGAASDVRWEKFSDLLSNPVHPSEL
jgi:hypothetical protein